MRTFSLLAIIVMLLAFSAYVDFRTGKELKIKNDRIRELEFQVWSLKLDKRLDSIKDYHVELFKRKLDSIHGQH